MTFLYNYVDIILQKIDKNNANDNNGIKFKSTIINILSGWNQAKIFMQER